MLVWSCEDRSAPFIDVFYRTATRAGYNVRLITPDDSPPSEFAEFSKHYAHFSPNSPSFELACFRRYFEIADQVAKRERAIIADTDLYVQIGPNNLPHELLDWTAGIAGSVGRNNDIPESEVSPHFSFWTGQLLRDFREYLINIYKNSPARLSSIYDERVKSGNSSPSISDMTLLNLWISDTKVPFLDTNRLFSETYIDHNLTLSEGQSVKFKTRYGRKAMVRKSNSLLFTTTDGLDIRPIVIHLQGRYKIISHDLEMHNDASVAIKSAYIEVGRALRPLVARLRDRLRC